MNEFQEFLLFVIEGALICFIFDIFRSIRNTFSAKGILIQIEDIVFLSIASAIFLYSVLYFCNGIIRLYFFIGLIVGILFYILTIGKKYFESSEIVVYRCR